ncbi:MAG: N-acetyltransferase, partial [Sphingobacteriales bacterium]
MTKTIETPRLLIRMVTVEEHRAVFTQYEQTDAMAFMDYDTEEQYLQEKKKVDGGMTTHRTSVLYFHLIEKQSARIVGEFAYHNWYPGHSRSEIGYAMRADVYKNQGYMKEAMLPILDYGFNQMKLNRIEAFISPKNEPSLKLVKRYGFVEEGLLRE